jgi:hypothetical protein
VEAVKRDAKRMARWKYIFEMRELCGETVESDFTSGLLKYHFLGPTHCPEITHA